MRPERGCTQEANQDAGSEKDADLDPHDPADRQADPEDARNRGPAPRGEGAAHHVQTRKARHHASAQPQPGEYQPLIDRARIARSRDA